jgi:AraC-like DNA-binding protein
LQEAFHGPFDRQTLISSLRLDHAAQLIERRASIKTGQPFSDIAYACGFSRLHAFARGFRRHFGTTRAAQAPAAATTHESAPDIGKSQSAFYNATLTATDVVFQPNS